MIETTLLDWLQSKLPDPAYMEKTPGAPARHYVLEKLGGSVKDHIWNAVFAVQSCAPSMLEAAEMNSEVIKAMLAAPELPKICDVQLNADYNYTDTASKGYRYQAVFDICYKE